ncbi:MAG: V-type ATP synthase subunit E [Spirochaetes bacterium]|nr:V-type ATP synthase subunit E [Spirochaetota bacterium]
MSDNGNILKKEIINDARNKAVRIISKAEKECAAIIIKAEEKSKKECDSIFERVKAKAEIESNKILAGTNLEIKRNRLSKVNLFLEGIVKEALDRISEIKGQAAEGILEKNINNALAALSENEVQIIVSKDIAEDIIHNIMKKNKIKFSIKKSDKLFSSEVIVNSRDGFLRYESVFLNNYKSNKDIILKPVYKILFGGDNE